MPSALNDTIRRVTDRIAERSQTTRTAYLDKIAAARAQGVKRAHLSCGNQAHAYAAMGSGIRIVLWPRMPPTSESLQPITTCFRRTNPSRTTPTSSRPPPAQAGGTAQVAGGVPAMCDGVTQGQTGMELSLFSRDVIALAAGVALSHNTFDSALVPWRLRQDRPGPDHRSRHLRTYPRHLRPCRSR